MNTSGNKNTALSLYHNEAFDKGFYKYFKNISGNRISEVLNSTDRNVKIESITYRQLNSWESEGLLTVQREGREWRKFSIIDALWLKIIKELRDFGMSREQLKATKQSLEFESEKLGVSMPMLEFYAAFMIGAKMPVVLLVFKDGIAVPSSFTQYRVAREMVGIENHVQLSLNDLMQGMFPDVDLKERETVESNLSVNEMELLAFLRIGKFEKIEIKCSSGKMEKFEGTQRVTASKRIQEILKENPYQDIKVQQEDGKITAVFQTIKKRFSKGSNPK